MPPAAARSPLPRLAAALGVLLAAGPAPAADPPVRITAARVGFPVVPREGTTPAGDSVCKFGAWAPVYADLEIVAAVTEWAELVVETPDADGVMTSLAVPIRLADVKPGQTVAAHAPGWMAYARPAGGAAETTITVRTENGKAPLSEPYRIRNLHTRDALSYVVLGLGSTLPGFDLPKPGGGIPDPNAPPGPLRNGRVEVATIARVDDLPQKWIGYDGADLVVLPTANAAFVRDFLRPASGLGFARLEALQDWVRRGGRLVISAGAITEPLTEELLSVRGLFAVGLRTDAPFRTVNQLPVFWSSRETSQSTVQSGVLRSATPFPVANLALPGRGRVVSPPPARQGEGTEPVAVQIAYGLGKVTIIGFDLDRPPFAPEPTKPGDKGFAGRAEFWDWVLREGGASRASVGNETKPVPSTTSGPTGDEDEAATALRTHLDTFASVPVVSFGGVAALIALYGLLVAPVEYLFLRRVVRRPEWTWVTLPLIVLTVAVAAYLTAARTKGADLRVNKVDVVDVLPADRQDEGRVYGTTWFTVFAPRSEAFSVSIVPSADWTRLGRGTVGWSGGPRGGRAGLLRRRYEYTDGEVGRDGRDATQAVDRVPVSTWSSKAFAGTWEGFLPETLAESRLEHPPGDPTRAVGTFVNKLPVPELSDCVAFYAGQAYPLGTILSGQEVRLVLDRGPPATQWFQENARLADLLGRATGRPGAAGGLALWGLLFHEAALRNDEGVIPRNASVRRLDQSWRLAPDNRDEVIVVGRVTPPSGPAGGLFDGPASPTKFWLHAPPGRWHEQPPPVPGVGRQETYVRLYLPVK